MMHPNHAWRMFVSLARKCALAEDSDSTLIRTSPDVWLRRVRLFLDKRDSYHHRLW
jgi:hypothetical protein